MGIESMNFVLSPKGAISALSLATLLVASGCGGGGKGLGGGGGGPTEGNPLPTNPHGNPAPVVPLTGTAKFSVDAETGKVTVTPLTGNATTRAIFTGSALRFQSNDLISDPGELTRRKLAVQLVNNTGETVGSSAGFKVMFGEFKTGLSTDLRASTTVSTVIGSGGSGSQDGPALTATLSSPHSVLVDDQDAIYFSGYNQSLRVSRNGIVNTTIKNIGPVTSMIWRGGDSGDSIIYAASLNTHRIYKLDVSNNTATLLAGTGSSGAIDGPGSSARFNLPYSIAEIPNTDATNPDLLVSEGTTGKLRRMTWDGSEYQVSTLGFTNDAPRGMISMGNGYFAVCEAFVRKITIFDLSGNKVSLGQGNSGQGDGDGNSMTFFEPIGVIKKDNSLFVSESCGTIRQLNLPAGGNLLFKEAWRSVTVAGAYQAYGFADGPGDQARFLGPVCMAIDNLGRLLVADSGNSRIRRVAATNSNFPFETPGGSSSGVDKVRLSNPTDFVPTDTGSTPYILESKTIVSHEAVDLTPWELIVPDGVKSFEFVVTIEAQTDSTAPPDAVFNSGPTPGAGSSNAMVRTLTGATIPGYANGSMSGAAFASPTAFAYDASGVLYVADALNRAIRRVSPDGRVTTVAGVAGLSAGAVDGAGQEILLDSGFGPAPAGG